MRVWTSVLAVTLVFNSTFAGAQEIPVAAKPAVSYISFTKNPFTVVQIERTSEQKFIFSRCDRGDAGVSNCAPIGRSEGYTAEELNGRARGLRIWNWVKNLITIPAGTYCGAMLGAGVGAVQASGIMAAGFATGIAGLLEMSMVGAFYPPAMVSGAGNMVGGFAAGIMGMVTIVAYGALGTAVGAPTSWWASRKWIPGFRQGREALRFAADSVVKPDDVLEINSSPEQYIKNITKALNGIK